MRIYIAGLEARDAYLSDLARRRGHQTGPGPWDVAVLPLPRSRVTEELIDQLPKGQKIVCGLTDANFDRLAAQKGWRLLRALEDARYTLENAALTAEGAIYFAMRQADFALRGACCAVIGYGRIGKALTSMLRGLGARVTVAARRRESRDAAGPNSVSLEELPSLLPQLDLLFNTVPAPVIGKEQLALMSKDALLLELASPPYGIDLAAAEQMGLRAWLESGIPGRYCPASAAKALLDLIERGWDHE